MAKIISKVNKVWNDRLTYDEDKKANLRFLIHERKMNLDLFFAISLNLCDLLIEYSINGLLNLRINPQNINIDLSSMEVSVNNKCFKSIDEFNDYGGLEVLCRDSISYISPELSGMMNRTVDYRSDFYSIGAVLYEMLTYKCPFEVNTASEIIYSHTAKLAVPPYKINRDIPVQVSNIVMKLLSKNPEDRYKTSWGIKHDLERCYNAWKVDNTVSKFKLAEKDILDVFEIPQKNYGREADVKNILSAYNRIAEGAAEIVIVSGENGMGKSWIAQRVKERIVAYGGYCVSGKSNQINFNIPYESILQALTELVKKILSESKEEIELIHNELIEVLGNNIQVMIDLIPELSFILGKKKSYVEISSSESDYRFNMLFQKFIKVFSRKNHPLVIFLDDVQWSHPASMRLITNLFKYYDNKYMLIILGYRGAINTRTKPKDSVELLLHDLKGTNTKVSKISLKPLNYEEVNRLLSDALNCEPKETEGLARVVINKTYGNPMFIDQLMKIFYDRRLLKFDYENKAWAWDIKKIIRESIPDNVVDIVAQKLVNLPHNTKKLIRLAACLRSQFDIQTLAVISEMSLTDTLYFFNPAIEAGLVEIVDDSKKSIFDITLEELLNKLEFKFVHDCIQQSAYSMNWLDNHADLHLKVGRLLLENCNAEEFNVKIFDIVNHLNYAKSMISDKDQRLKLVGLNLLAGKKAKNANDYESALNYFNEGITFLTQDKWEKHYGLTFGLSIECAECEFLIGHEAKAESILEEIFVHTKNITHRIDAYIIQVKILANTGKHREAIDKAMEGLVLRNIYIEEDIDSFELTQRINKTMSKLQGNLENIILEKPELKDQNIIGILKLISELSQSALLINVDLWKVCVLKIVEISMIYGNSSVSAIGYAGLGHMMCQTNNNRYGYRLGLIALNLANVYEDINIKMRVYYIFGYYICALRENYAISISYLEKSFEYAINLGKLYYARIVGNCIILTKLLTGNRADTIRKEWTNYFNISKKIEVEAMNYADILLKTLMACEEVYETGYISELLNRIDTLEKDILQCGIDPLAALYYFVKIKLLGVLGSFEEATNLIIEKREAIGLGTGIILSSSFYYMGSILLCRFIDECKIKLDKKYLSCLEENLLDLEVLSTYNKENYATKYLLIKAEVNRIQGNYLACQSFYERSLEKCMDLDAISDAALTCECAASFYLKQGLETSAIAYANKAKHYYEVTGTMPLLGCFDKDKLLGTLMDRSKALIEKVNKTTSETIITDINVDTAIKISKIISEEIIMDRLLIKLMNIAMENAGAQKGFLILYENDKFIIKVEGDISEGKESRGKHVFLDSFNNIAKSVIYYCFRTMEPVILNNAPLDNIFSSDKYILKCRPQSIMCTPIIYNENLIGAIYLENSLASNVFKSTKLEILRLISSQAAIAIANARMFEQVNELNDSLENKVTERTRAIEDTLIKLENEIENSKKLKAALEYDRLKTEFFANISHELRTPLNVILTANQMSNVVVNQLNKGELKDKIKKYLDLTKQNSYRLIRLTNNLIDITKIDAGYIKLTLCNCDVIKLVEDITLSVVEYAKRKKIELIFDTDVEEKYLACDPDMIERIILNLLSNAIKFSDIGGHIQVSIFDFEDKIKISVKDSGMGIPEDKLGSVFDRFVQVDKSLSRSCEGSGIGLSLVKSLTEMQGGRIEVQSKEGIGSEFIIELPVKKASNTCDFSSIECKDGKVERISIEFSDIYF